MADAELTIHRLRLGPAPPGLAVRLEDALRTSSKPAALLHRHVLVRRLRLRMPRAASAQGIAAQLEQAWQRIAALATPLERAVDADEVVWAPSEATARAALVLRWARGDAPTAWFWRRIALPAGDATAWPQRAWRLMLAPLVADGPRGAVAMPGGFKAAGPAAPALRPVLQALADAGALPRFAALLTAAEARQLIVVIEADAQAAAAWLSPPAGPGAAPPALGRSLSTGVLACAWQLLQARLSDGPPLMLGSAPLRPPAEVQAGGQQAAAMPSLDEAWPLAQQREAHTVAGAALPTGAVVAPATPLDALDTAWAGLWLLLPVLLRCGLDDDDAPFVAFAQALQAAPGALHIPADDPVRTMIAALDLPPIDAPGPWLRRARLAALRNARLPLRRIARRHGMVHLSDVRLDVVFPVRAADVRIRRAGFDLDPGFVPWLGRIVHFHYV